MATMWRNPRTFELLLETRQMRRRRQRPVAGTAGDVAGEAAAEAEDAQDVERGAAPSIPGSSPGTTAGPPPPQAGEDPTANAETAVSPPQLYRLGNGAGEWLDGSGVGMTRRLDKAWRGTAQQVEVIFKSRPHLKTLDAEPAH